MIFLIFFISQKMNVTLSKIFALGNLSLLLVSNGKDSQARYELRNKKMFFLNNIFYYVFQEIIDNELNGPIEDSDGTKNHYFANIDSKDSEKVDSTGSLISSLMDPQNKPSFCFSFDFDLQVMFDNYLKYLYTIYSRT